ncbi:transcription antitermination protein NusG [Streptococcus iniae]|nr:transcription antitermination protein NusG [Streptococcus iniae]ATX38676.1 Transcription termination/antitermination protein NusG [Streptococcus iniae]
MTWPFYGVRKREFVDREVFFYYNESDEKILKAARGFFLMKGNIMLDSFDKGWFVLQTYSGYENKVKENLLLRAQTYDMLDNILRVEIPTQTVNVEKNGQSKEIEENRFPGYVLVEMVMTDEAWFVVRNTPNVTGFVGSHGNRSKPTPLLEEEIRAILLSMGQTIDVFDTNIKEGDLVQIIDGAFMGQEGRVVEIENNKVKLMLNMFGSETVAEVELYQIAELS